MAANTTGGASTWPDTVNRLARAKSLITQCAEVQVKLLTAKSVIQSRAEATSQEYNDVIKLILTPPEDGQGDKYDDLLELYGQMYEPFYVYQVCDPISITSGTFPDGKPVQFTAPEWDTLAISEIFVGIFAGQGMSPLLRTANIIASAADQVAAAAKQGNEAGAKAVAQAAINLAMETAEVGAHGVVGPMWSEILTAGPSADAAAVASAVIQAATGSLDGAANAEELQKLISAAFQARIGLKILDFKIQTMMNTLDLMVSRFSGAKTIFKPGDKDAALNLKKFAVQYVQLFQEAVATITRQNAVERLQYDDNQAGEWTKEDPAPEI